MFAYLQYSITERLSVMGNAQYDSKRYSSSDGLRIAEGYTVAGAKASYELRDGLFLEGGVDNLFDEDYELTEGYPRLAGLLRQLAFQLLSKACLSVYEMRRR